MKSELPQSKTRQKVLLARHNSGGMERMYFVYRRMSADGRNLWMLPDNKGSGPHPDGNGEQRPA